MKVPRNGSWSFLFYSKINYAFMAERVMIPSRVSIMIEIGCNDLSHDHIKVPECTVYVIFKTGEGEGVTDPPAMAILIRRLVSPVICPSQVGRVCRVLLAVRARLCRDNMPPISSGRNSL